MVMSILAETFENDMFLTIFVFDNFYICVFFLLDRRENQLI